MDVVAAEWREARGEVVAPGEVTDEQLARIHDPEYLRRIAETAGTAAALDPDTYTSPETYEIARLAAGAAVDAVERVMSGSHQRALAMLRPPGHHAERDRAMGFCLYNNAAIAAAHARTLGAERIAVVDYDVHHGNGTQHIFEHDPAVLYVSTHQYPYYPGTGAVTEIGEGGGTGFTINVPLEAGAVDEDYRVAFTEIIVPVLRQFAPNLVIVSAGFDAHERDPLAGMRLTTGAFAAMTMELRGVAEEYCDGRLVAVTEGGYDLRALADCLRTTIAVLAADAPAAATWSQGGPVAPRRGRAAVDAARTSLSRYWKL